MHISAENSSPRRRFLKRFGAWAGVAAAVPVAANAQTKAAGGPDILPNYARAQNYKSLKQSSYDRTGGNADQQQHHGT